ncbi:MAG: DUF255 domain-containing protein [Hyphomicrobium sp.]
MATWRSWLVAAFCLGLANPASSKEGLQWTGWSGEMLARAKSEQRLIILDLEAVWCHWCHVMEETTYSDPKVVGLLKSKFITVRVDQDANPDLSARYGDWGWPATIIFAPDGTELVKRRGYIPPENMAALLQAVIDDPTPGPSAGGEEVIAPALSSSLSAVARKKLIANFTAGYDAKYGGWGDVHKFIDADSMDYVLQQAERGDANAARMAATTLTSALALIDRADGGIYQYSDEADWLSPHYEKIMWYQANGLRQYAGAYAQFKDGKYLAAASDIYRYITTSLQSPDGPFFTSQDADVDATLAGKLYYKMDAAARSKVGRAPRIDTNIYARENGWAISGLTAYANVTGDIDAVVKAERAADWIVANRRGADGLFRHGDKDRGGPYLGDTISMGAAALDLYAATGKRKWLDVAAASGAALAEFRDNTGGFSTSKVAEGTDGVLAKPYRNLDEQVQAARFAIRVWRYIGNATAKELAEHAIKYLASDTIAESGRMAPGILLADIELSREPTHVTIVGHKDDASAIALHAAARAYPAMNKRVDWWDVREGAMLNPDVTYPELDQAAAFACSNKLCSLPAFSAGELTEVVANMLRRSADTAAQ